MKIHKLHCYFTVLLGLAAMLVTAKPVAALASSQVISNVSVGLGWSNYDYRDPWRWNVGVSNSWYGYPYRNGYYRPGWRPGYNWGVGSRWRYPYGYNNRYYSPYRYDRQSYKAPEPKVVRPPERITTSVSYSTGLTRLPDNARVIQKDGRTVYEWQGVEYMFDWNTNTYQKVTGNK
ncbi:MULTISPECIES: hypothetical protein [unclassified Shewanella]|uniref:hypothetical protein n=1 Tax=unclassified Shewanella TaxID=196818 RepID=UPI001BB838F2|nr:MULTISPECIES: hypothetical protein [unclassified Shewanella]GIU20972.1 hypothetical protein TUM4444_39960 [Shewanella sp. MBTL60-112-B1]GIU39318.1 hypothetical protein TUM4445_35400 [Shewanella sp. MBTL60-112-B2]